MPKPTGPHASIIITVKPIIVDGVPMVDQECRYESAGVTDFWAFAALVKAMLYFQLPGLPELDTGRILRSSDPANRDIV